MHSIAIAVLLLVVPAIYCENIFKINISPEEAQQFLKSANLNVDYAPKTGENPLPVVQNEKGEFIYQGRKYDNPSEYVEEHYTAHQYHGQDGLGEYVYGYKDWNQGKAEQKTADGVVKGTYKYVNPRGRDFIANYYADHSGFHQEDNRPAAEKNPATETPAVKAAKEEHFRLWSELAAANGQNPDPFSSDYQREGQYVPSASDSTYEHIEPKYIPSDEEKGDPRGFYYSFDYNVDLGRKIAEREELERLRAANNHD